MTFVHPKSLQNDLKRFQNAYSISPSHASAVLSVLYDHFCKMLMAAPPGIGFFAYTSKSKTEEKLKKKLEKEKNKLWCIYIRVGDIRLPTFFVFGVRDKCREQRIFVIFLVLDSHHCLYPTRTKPKIH